MYGTLARKEGKPNKNFKSDRTKTPGSYRKVLIPAMLAKQLKKLNYPNTSYLLINKCTNAPWTLFGVNGAFKKSTKKLGFDKTISTHIFRHTYISTLAEQRIPLNVIMKQVCQEDSKVTIQIYTHATDSETDNLYASLNSLSDNKF